MTTPETVLNAVIAAGHSARLQREEVLLEHCVYCNNSRWNLGLSAALGVFYCWACRTGGRVDALLEQLTGRKFDIPTTTRVPGQRQQHVKLAATGDVFPAVATVPSAVQYLERRGISPLTAAVYGLGICTDQSHLLRGRITIPAKDYWSGDVVGHWGRTYTGKVPKYLSTIPSGRGILGWKHKHGPKAVVMVEGAFDGIAVHRAGVSAAILGGTGLPAAAVEEWAGRVAPEITVGVWLDPDAATSANSLYWRLVAVRPPNTVQLIPGIEGYDPGSLAPEAIRVVLAPLLDSGRLV